MVITVFTIMVITGNHIINKNDSFEDYLKWADKLGRVSYVLNVKYESNAGIIWGCDDAPCGEIQLNERGLVGVLNGDSIKLTFGKVVSILDVKVHENLIKNEPNPTIEKYKELLRNN